MKNRKTCIYLYTLAFIVVQILCSNTPVWAKEEVFGSTFGLGLAIKEDGELWQWRSLKDGSEISPYKIIDNVAAMTLGEGYVLLIKADGSLWGFGNNDSGQLGDKTTAYRDIPVKIMEQVISAAAGEKHSLAVTQDGSLWAWGGRTGLSPQKIMEDVRSVYTGKIEEFAIKNDGSLWNWKNNTENLLSENNIIAPLKIADDVLSVASGYGFGGGHTLIVKSNGSLWAYGLNTMGQIGDGTIDSKEAPVKIMDNVLGAAAGEGKSLAVTSDGSLWAWGRWIGNSPQKIMENVQAVNIDIAGSVPVVLTADGVLWEWDFFNEKAKKIMEGIMLPGLEQVAQQSSSAADSYIYDIEDSGLTINFPAPLLSDISDPALALAAIKTVASGLTNEQKASASGIDLLTLFAEEAIAQAASLTFDDAAINIDLSDISNLQISANELKNAAVQALAAAGVNVMRDIQNTIILKTAATENLSINIGTSMANIAVDQLRVQTPDYQISFSRQALKANLMDKPLLITINVQEEAVSGNALSAKYFFPFFSQISPNHASAMSLKTLPALSSRQFIPKVNIAIGGKPGAQINKLARLSANKAYSITFNKMLVENVKLSMPPLAGDHNYQAIVNSNGHAVGGKYNPISAMLEAKIKDTDLYFVKENQKDFSDIFTKSQEMQKAIRILAAKGIINGSTTATFSPDAAINRAEIAALIVRTLFKLDANADGGFSDVRKADWFFGAVGSAKRYGIINGVSASAFAPQAIIKKDQIVAICARTLRIEMNYKDALDLEHQLSVYSDRSELPAWGEADIALATQVNLVVKRVDGRFEPNATMTRGNAAIILYRMFMKIW
ncbi:MAG: S-layer homology domain-containing protein [Firmicutes bacterium]|nr:S-layer homology domain-containing protein [Bacillota bacterium]